MSLCFPLIFSCGDSGNSGQSGPDSVKENTYENSKLTLIELIREKPYNSEGYILEGWDSTDKYGEDKWKKVLHLKIDKNTVDEMKKYKDAYTYWQSNDGSLLIDCMINCFKSNTINCNCN
jgi:hypothetical protein